MIPKLRAHHLFKHELTMLPKLRADLLLNNGLTMLQKLRAHLLRLWAHNLQRNPKQRH